MPYLNASNTAHQFPLCTGIPCHRVDIMLLKEIDKILFLARCNKNVSQINQDWIIDCGRSALFQIEHICVVDFCNYDCWIHLDIVSHLSKCFFTLGWLTKVLKLKSVKIEKHNISLRSKNWQLTNLRCKRQKFKNYK